MKTSICALLTAVVISTISPSYAADPVLTLDNLKTQHAQFLESAHGIYTLTEVSDTVPDGAITVKIEDKTYYYTPNEGDNVTLLKTLASTGHAALKETNASDALYTINGKYYSYDIENLPASGYKLSSINISDPEALPSNVITLYEKNEVVKYYDPSTGKEVASDQLQPDVEYKEVTTIETTPKYYEVALNKTEYGNPNGDKSVSVTIDKLGQTVTYKYTEPEYNQTEANHTKDVSTTDPSGTSDSHSQLIGGSALNNPAGATISIDGVLYKDNSVTGTITSTTPGFKAVDILGGAVYNAGEISSIVGGFINNSIEVESVVSPDAGNLGIYAQGGAIYNKGTIGDIVGGFIANYALSSGSYTYGGTIYNEGTIGNITGDFIGNYVSASVSSENASGGAIYNNGTIGDITGDFIGNYASASDSGSVYTSANGGVIYNDGTIGDITGDFVGNYASSDSSANGGAIYNSGTIGDITGDFVGNYASSDSSAYGGAIYNGDTIGDITGDFIGNYVSSSSGSSAYGGAIYNLGTIGDITGDFIGNYVSGVLYAYGGAIYNYRDSTIIGNITGDFIGNYASATGSTYAYGGAIYNFYGIIGDITGDFIGNYATSITASYADGGAIYNDDGTIGDIIGDFIGNYAFGSDSSAQGGAIYNSGIIGDITGDFIGNYAISPVSSTFQHSVIGGAVCNYGTLGDITGDFIENYTSGAVSNFADASGGGAIFNADTLGDITGNFIANYANSSDSSASGGAIFNGYYYATIGDITGNFIGNYAISSSSGYSARGGAIYNDDGTIGDITGDFIGNYAAANTSADVNASGGAIFNSVTIGDITGDFIGNYASGSSYAHGGAIYNGGTIGDITGDFIGNYATSSGSSAYGGAISKSSGTIGNITGNFIGNYASASVSGSYASAHGGAIYHQINNMNGISTIGNITGDFIGNYASSDSSAYGGAIDNYAYEYTTEIGDISGNFIGNYAVSAESSACGGAISNWESTGGTAKIGSIRGDFIGNHAIASNDDTYDGSFNGAYGGAIYNTFNGAGDVSIAVIAGDFAENYVKGYESYGGAIFNTVEIASITGDFVNNYAEGVSTAFGGAIVNAGMISSYDVPVDQLLQLPMITINISDTGESYTFYQGIPTEALEELEALYEAGYKIIYVSAGEQTMTSAEWEQVKPELDAMLESGEMATESPIGDKYMAQLTGGLVNSSFFGNYAKSTEGEAKGGAIYTMTDLMITADNGNSVFSGNYVEDVNGKRPEAVYVDSPTSTLTLQAKNEGTILFDDQINGASGYKLKLDGDSTGRVILNNDVINAKVDLNEVTLQLGREDVLNQSQSLALNSGTLSLLNNGVGTMHLPELSLNGAVNMAVDADLANKTMDRITADKYNISQDSKLNVNLINLISDAKEDKTDIEFAAPSYSSQVSYTGDNPIAYSKIYKYDVSYNPEDGYFTFLRGSSGNPSDNFNPTVLSPAVTTQAAGYSTQMQVFNYAFQHSDNFMNLPYMDRLAASKSNQYALINDSTVGPYSPIFTRVNQGGAWFKPYVSFENIPLKNGPTVDNIAYGSLIGYDSKLTPIKHGFERVLTGYVGYNGASQSYPGVDTYQNGGLLGGTVTLYKGNFFNATTLSAGASVGESSNMYGHENYTMLLAGIGNKLGYNFEFKRGRYILQPSMLMSYTFVNTFDYTNSAGTRMTSDPLHAIQLSPGLKFIMNTKNGWQPYAAVNMVWNIFTDQNAKADNISLPNMSIKPYVQYGLGVQKLIKDKFLAFGQALVSNGGRNGISFSFGLRWLIGRE